MATLYLMRHGETLFNVQQKIQGWCDSPLTENGIEQARAAGRCLAERGVHFDHAYCSTAERACDTLELVLEAAGQKLPYERLKGLREHNHGILEGESERINHTVPMEKADEFYLMYGGESFDQTTARVTGAIYEFMARPNPGDVLAVSHAGACVSALQTFADVERIMRAGIGNCTIWVLSYDESRPGVPEAFELEDIIVPGA